MGSVTGFVDQVLADGETLDSARARIIEVVGGALAEVGFGPPVWEFDIEDEGDLMVFAPDDAPGGYEDELQKALDLVGDVLPWPGL